MLERFKRCSRLKKLLLLAGLLTLPTAFVNRRTVFDLVERYETEKHFRKVGDNVLLWGSPEARLHITAYLPFSCLCQRERLAILSEAARKYGKRLYIELIDIDSAVGARQFHEAGLMCTAILFNGSSLVRLTRDGKTRKVDFSGPPPQESRSRNGYTGRELRQAIEEQVERLYARAQPPVIPPAATALASSVPVTQPPKAKAADKPVEKDLDADSFDVVARALFAPVYPSLAAQLVKDYHLNEGVGMDIGSGPAYLTIELAKRTRLKFFGLDVDPEAVAVGRKNVAKAGLSKRIKILQGNVEDLPFMDEFADMVVSRCSVPCWKDKPKAFREIYRVLKPGGVAFVGYGSGRDLPKAERLRIARKLEEIRKRLGPMRGWIQEMPSDKVIRSAIGKAGIGNYKILKYPPDGLWAEIRKPRAKPAKP